MLSIYGRGMNAELERHNTETDYQNEFGKTTSDINKQSYFEHSITCNSLSVFQYTPHYTILHCTGLHCGAYHIYDNNLAQWSTKN